MDKLAEINERERRQEAQGDFLRMIWCQGKAVIEGDDVRRVAAKHFGERSGVFNMLQKAAVGGGTTFGDVDLAYARMSTEWVSLLSSRTLLGRLMFRLIDFNTRTIIEDVPGEADWTGEGKPARVCSMNIDAVHVGPAKMSGLVVFTKELFKLWTRATSQQMNRSMLRVIGIFSDRALLDPAFVAVTNESPAALTAGITPIASTGSTEAAISADIASMLDQHAADGQDLTEIILVMSPSTAAYMARLKTSGGQVAYPGLGVRGGEIWGVPVETSNGARSVAGSPTENVIVTINPNGILLADDGQISVTFSDKTAIQMDDAPDNDATTGSGSTVVSLWHTESVGALFSRRVNWLRAVDSAVSYMRVTY